MKEFLLILELCIARSWRIISPLNIHRSLKNPFYFEATRNYVVLQVLLLINMLNFVLVFVLDHKVQQTLSFTEEGS